MAYSVEEVCEIIKTCRKFGVTTFDHADLKLQLAQQEPQTPEARPVRLTKEQREKAEIAEAKAREELEADLRLEQLAELRIADPLAYEELIARGELEHVGKESDGIDG